MLARVLMSVRDYQRQVQIYFRNCRGQTLVYCIIDSGSYRRLGPFPVFTEKPKLSGDGIILSYRPMIIHLSYRYKINNRRSQFCWIKPAVPSAEGSCTICWESGHYPNTVFSLGTGFNLRYMDLRCMVSSDSIPILRCQKFEYDRSGKNWKAELIIYNICSEIKKKIQY